jgi:hypothetical protein
MAGVKLFREVLAGKIAVMGILPSPSGSPRISTDSPSILKEKALIALSDFKTLRGSSGSPGGVSIHFNNGLGQAVKHNMMADMIPNFFIYNP